MNVKIGPDLIEVLQKAIQQEGECRLVARGARLPGLLPGTGKKTEALQAHCLNPESDLFRIVREATEGSGKSAKKSVFVELTPKGVEALFESLPVEAHAAVIERTSPQYARTARDASVRVAAGRMKALQAELSDVVNRQQQLSDLLKSIAEQQRKALSADRERLETAIKSAERLLVDADEKAPDRSDGRGKRNGTSKSDEPRSEEDLDFQRDVAEELVYAWKDSPDQNSREALERVMRNAGLMPVGDAGEKTSFDGRLHVTDDDLDPGDPAMITEPGWRLTNSRGNYLIARARVRRQPTLQESTAHGRHD